MGSTVLTTEQVTAAPDDVPSIVKRLTKANLRKRVTMAVSQSTSQQLSLEKSPSCRRLTVGYIASSARREYTSHIRIMGRWVADAGFAVGSGVNVHVFHGRWVIERQPNLAAFIALAWSLHEEPRELFDKLLTAMRLPPGARPVLNKS
jgi:Toxin SymE, type I toxin-antitoxin system